MTSVIGIQAIAIAFVTLAVALEYGFYLRRGARAFDRKEAAVSLLSFAGFVVVGLVIRRFYYVVNGWVWRHRILTLHLTGVWEVLALAFIFEFFYYWAHRADHTFRWLWANHSVHHSSIQINVLSNFRVGWTRSLTGAWIIWIPAVWLGFRPGSVALSESFVLLSQTWSHTELMPKVGVLEWFLTTPSNHRVHHAKHPRYLNRNFGGMSVVFDRIFGTYAAECDDIPCEFGLVEHPKTYNLLRIQFQEWSAILKDLAAARSWRGRLQAILKLQR